jgi:hypothetical protein
VQASDYFRITLAQAKRRMRRSPIFRDPLYAMAELEDPEQPGRPFVQHGPLPALERKWFFKRDDGVPPWIKLWVGSAARRRMLQGIEKEFDLPPAERFKLIEESLQCTACQTLDPENWNNPFLCAIKLPAPEPIWWWGKREIALSNPVLRDWYHNNEVFHGAAAYEVVQREWSKWG